MQNAHKHLLRWYFYLKLSNFLDPEKVFDTSQLNKIVIVVHISASTIN